MLGRQHLRQGDCREPSLDRPRERGAVRDVAVAGEPLELRDRRLGDPVLADGALNSARQRQLPLRSRRVPACACRPGPVAERSCARPQPHAGSLGEVGIARADVRRPAPRPDRREIQLLRHLACRERLPLDDVEPRLRGFQAGATGVRVVALEAEHHAQARRRNPDREEAPDRRSHSLPELPVAEDGAERVNALGAEVRLPDDVRDRGDLLPPARQPRPPCTACC